MGLVPSKDNNPSSRQSSNQEREYPKHGLFTEKSTEYKEKSVFFQDIEMVENDLDYYQDKRVSEMIVCKRGYADHWFVVLKVKMSVSQTMLFGLHYYDNSTIVIKTFKEDQDLTKTVYSPKRITDLKAIIQLCLKIVRENSYNYAFYNCQTVVTKVMEAFTDRQVNRFFNMLKIPIKGDISKPLSSSFRGSQLEKEFLETYKKDGLSTALSELERENDYIENTLQNLCGFLMSPQNELEDFKEKALTQIYDSGLINEMKKMENSQTKDDKNRIVCQFARSTYLSNTICSINFTASLSTDESSDEFAEPSEVLERERMETNQFLNVPC